MSAAGPMNSTGPDSAPGQGGVPSKRGRRMKTIPNVNTALGWLWRQVELGSIDLARARVLVYLAATLISGLEKGELEERIAALEAAQADKGRP